MALIWVEGAERYVAARAPACMAFHQKGWTPNKQDEREQALLRKALETGAYDCMTDEDWCRMLEQMDEAEAEAGDHQGDRVGSGRTDRSA